MGGTRANLLGRHLHLLAEIVQKSRHARGLLAITLRLAEAIPLCTAQEGDGEEEDDDEVAIARDETVAKILDDGNEQREKHEKRHAVPYSVVDLTVLHDVSIGIELQEKTSRNAANRREKRTAARAQPQRTKYGFNSNVRKKTAAATTTMLAPAAMLQ